MNRLKPLLTKSKNSPSQVKQKRSRIPVWGWLVGVCLIITGATVLQLALVASGLPSWRSPILSFFGISDLGDGLTRAIVALLQGDWQTSLTFHVFDPFFVIALTLIAMVAVLPAALNDRLLPGLKKGKDAPA